MKHSVIVTIIVVLGTILVHNGLVQPGLAATTSQPAGGFHRRTF